MSILSLSPFRSASLFGSPSLNGPPPRAGYANRRSPAALAAAIALNGSAFVLVIALPAAEYVRSFDPPLIVHEVRLAPAPPVIDPPEPTRERIVTQKTLERQPPKETIEVVDPIGPIIGGDGAIELTKGTPTGVGGGLIELPFDPPSPPVFAAARPDPRYADAFHPDYPPALRREGLEGSVTVRVTIDVRGRVTAVEMVKATNAAFFEETKRQALREWRFKPATRDGVAISAEQVMTVHFQLED